MPSKSYIAPEASTTWQASGGDLLLDLGGAAAASANVGAYKDLGSGSRSDVYEVMMFINGFDSAPAVGQTIDLFFAQSNATTGFDGPMDTDPTSSAEGTLGDLDKLGNLLYAGSCVVYDTGTSQNIQARMVVRLTSRYVAPVVINRANTLESTTPTHRVVLTPIPQESQ